MMAASPSPPEHCAPLLLRRVCPGELTGYEEELCRGSPPSDASAPPSRRRAGHGATLAVIAASLAAPDLRSPSWRRHLLRPTLLRHQLRWGGCILEDDHVFVFLHAVAYLPPSPLTVDAARRGWRMRLQRSLLGRRRGDVEATVRSVWRGTWSMPAASLSRGRGRGRGAIHARAFCSTARCAPCSKAPPQWWPTGPCPRGPARPSTHSRRHGPARP